MSVNLLKLIKPSDFQLGNQCFWDSPLKNLEMEAVARSIVFISKKHGDKWEPFSFNDYKKRCTHNARSEEKILRLLAQKGVLTEVDGVYMVTNEFFKVFFDFIDTEQ